MPSTFTDTLGAATFGSRLRILRADRNMGVLELAIKSGVNRTTVHRLERDGSRPSRETVEGLARALDVSPEAFTD